MTNESTLSPGLARETGWTDRWGALVLALLVGLLLGLAARDLATGAVGRLAAAREPAAAAREWPERELPREWRWAGPQYRFDQMFRLRNPSPRG